MASVDYGKANHYDLQQAICENRTETVLAILSHAKLLDINKYVSGATAVSLALYKECDQIFEILLSYSFARPDSRLNLNLLSRDDKGRIEPPIVTAIRLRNTRAFELLVRYGCAVNAVDSYNHSALWMACRQRREDLVLRLIGLGTEVNPSDKWSQSPLYLSLKYPRRAAISRLLLLNGASPLIAGESRTKTLLSWAVFHNQADVVRLLHLTGYNCTAENCVRPDYLQVLSIRLSRNQALLAWLRRILSEPKSLRHRCRTVIREAVSASNRGSHFLRRLRQLPLPRCVMAYVCLETAADEVGGFEADLAGSSDQDED